MRAYPHARPRSRRRVILLLAAALLLSLCGSLSGAARAQAPSFGVSVIPITGGWPEGMVTVRVPFYTYETNEGPLVLAGRLDVSAPLNFSELPRIGLSGTGLFTSHDMFQPYFGAGAVLGWVGPPEAQAIYVTPTLLGGVRFPLTEIISAQAEAIVAPFVGRISVGVGVELAVR